MTQLRAPGLAALALTALTSGCAGPSIDLEAWRAGQVAEASAEASSEPPVLADLQRVETLRSDRQLAEARELALLVVTAHPEHPGALKVASRAESDAVFMFADDDKHSRNHAAASALDYALAAEQRGAESASDRAQLAWALGTSTHLQPMFDRADHAQRTIAAAEAALELDPGEATALATLALVNWRLETLPWIAKVMAWGAPDSDLADAERFARRAVECAPSRENRQILAKVLIAADRSSEARVELDLALAAPSQFPRDTVLEPVLRSLRESLDQ